MSVAEFLYTTVLAPKPLKAMANAVIRQCIPSRLERHGAVVVLNAKDPVVSGALTLGVYEKAETAFFCAVCREGMTFLDVGANIGYYTALASARVGPRGKIVALEPDPENFRFLERTVAANGARDVTCIQKAASDAEGILRLYISIANRGDNRLWAYELSDNSFEVAVSTVDSMLGERGVRSVNLVKMDVQGYEGRVLRGMRETLGRSDHVILLAEFWPFGLRSAGTAPEELLEGLRRDGMRLYTLTERGGLARLTDQKALIAKYPGTRYTNIVAVRGEPLPGNLEGAA